LDVLWCSTPSRTRHDRFDSHPEFNQRKMSQSSYKLIINAIFFVYWLYSLFRLYSVTLAVPKSSQRRRIVAVNDIMGGKPSTKSTVSLLMPWPRRKNMWTSTTCTPELTIPFLKYSSGFGNFPEANHFASSKNALHNFFHCNNQIRVWQTCIIDDPWWQMLGRKYNVCERIPGWF